MNTMRLSDNAPAKRRQSNVHWQVEKAPSPCIVLSCEIFQAAGFFDSVSINFLASAAASDFRGIRSALLFFVTTQ